MQISAYSRAKKKKLSVHHLFLCRLGNNPFAFTRHIIFKFLHIVSLLNHLVKPEIDLAFPIGHFCTVPYARSRLPPMPPPPLRDLLLLLSGTLSGSTGKGS